MPPSPPASVFVLGFAKSGTTVISQTIARSLPGSVLWEEINRCIPPDQDRPSVAKVHINHFAEGSPELDRFYETYDRGVLLVRDPRDRMISESFFIPRGNYEQCLAFYRLIQAKERRPADFSVFPDLAAHVEHTRIDYERLERVREAMPQLHLIPYEKFMRGEWSELEDFLGLKLERTLADNRENLIHRSGKLDQWRDYLTAEDVAGMRPVLSPFLQRLGYPADDWDLNHPISLDPAVGSEYLVKKLGPEFSDRLSQEAD